MATVISLYLGHFSSPLCIREIHGCTKRVSDLEVNKQFMVYGCADELYCTQLMQNEVELRFFKKGRRICKSEGFTNGHWDATRSSHPHKSLN